MKQRNYLTSWKNEGIRSKLTFLDGSILYISKSDFDRAFGCIVCLTKEEIEANYPILDATGKSVTAAKLMHYLTYLAAIRCTNTPTPVSDVSFTVSEIQKAIDDIYAENDTYLEYRTVMLGQWEQP